MTTQTYGPNDYILFLGQEANFQTRSMLIPAKEFMEVRAEDYKLLKESAEKNYKFIIDGEEYVIDNILFQNYKEQGKGCFSQEQHEHSKVCNDLLRYADGMDDDWYCDMKDKVWYDKVPKTMLCNGFNHIKNYKFCKNITKIKGKDINIVDGFLVLEVTEGILKMPPCDTVEEMYEMFYNKKK